MSTDIKSSSSATHIGSIPRAEGETKAEAQAKAQTRIGARGDRDETKTEDPSDAMALLALHGDQNEGGLPPNGTFSLWQMLMAIMKYEKVTLDNNAEMQKNYAQNLGGPNGIFAKLYEVGCLVGQRDADSMRDDAYGKFAQAGVAGGSLLATGITYGVSTRPAINAGEETTANATAMEKAINESDAAIAIKEKPELANAAPKVHNEPAVQARVDGWADGSQPIENFKGSNTDDPTVAEQNRINDAAAKHVANDSAKRAKIQERINKQKESGQAQINNADQKFNTKQNIYSTAAQGLQNIAGAGAGIAQANSAEDKGQYSAAQTVISQAQQGIVQSENTAEKNAQDALQQANQWAAGFASAASSQVHA